MSGTEPHTSNDKDVREELPVFRSEEIRAQLMAIYDEALRHWLLRPSSCRRAMGRRMSSQVAIRHHRHL